MTINIVAPPISFDPVSWVQRYEVSGLVKELRSGGHQAHRVIFKDAEQVRNLTTIRLLRLSDKLMVRETEVLSLQGVQYAGPNASILASCSDKLNAYAVAIRHGVLCPETLPVFEYENQFTLALFKPRQGSDSLGIRIGRNGSIPKIARNDHYLVQPFIHGEELTIAILGNYVGIPFRILRPEGTIYSFTKKNFRRTARVRVEESSLEQRIRRIAETIQEAFGIDWAARVDLLYDRREDLIYFLECDATPLIGAASSFSESLALAGLARNDQWKLLLSERSHP